MVNKWIKIGIPTLAGLALLGGSSYIGSNIGYNRGKEAGYKEARPTELTGARIDGYQGMSDFIFHPGKTEPSYWLEVKEKEIISLHKIDAVVSRKEVTTGKTTVSLEKRLILDKVTHSPTEQAITFQP